MRDERAALAALPWVTRLAVGGTAAADVALRTGVASGLVLPAMRWAISGSASGEAKRLAFYRELADRGERSEIFQLPAENPRVTASAAPWWAFRPADGRVEMLRLESDFVAVNPALRKSYAGFHENRVAWAQHWRHDEGPRPTLGVIHGFGASPYWLNRVFFALPWIYGKGYDILLYVLPFHGARQPKLAPFSGWGLFAHGPAHLNEAILQGVYDFRLFAEHLRAQGAERVGVTGLSLGGYVAALLAGVDDRLAVSIPNVPVVDIGSLARRWFPASAALSGGRRLAGIGSDELDAALAVHSPLAHAPLIGQERRMIIGGLGDRMAPPDQARLLWEHWGRCRLHWFPGNHVVHLSRRLYLEEMLGFMRAAGFAA